MTKARARERAKAKAGQKAKRREAGADRTGGTVKPGQFGPGASKIKKPGVNAVTKVFGGARRGGARSI